MYLFLTRDKYSLQDYDETVQKHTGQYHGELLLTNKYTDASDKSAVYEYQTGDELQIAFEVHCFTGNKLTPFGFEIPVKEIIVYDNFPEQICAYVSERDGTYFADGKSIDEIAAYVLEVIEGTDVLFQKYGVKNRRPRIEFTFIKEGAEYSFTYGKSSEVILKDGLLELFIQ